VNAPHPDDFTLLVLHEGELSELEAARLKRHLAACAACAAAYREIEKLDRTLKSTASELEQALAEPELSEGDPFRCRPDGTRLGRPRPSAPATPEVLAASREAGEVKSRLLNAVSAPEEDLREALAALDLLALRDRYGLGYALDEALVSMVDGPSHRARFGRASRETVLEAKEAPRSSDAPAERAYPLDDLLGLSLLLEGAACNWSGDFPLGGRMLRRAYGAFARGSASARRLAGVELVESQRRTFLHRATEALRLADRARRTYEALGMEDEAAKARGGRAMALSYLGRDEEAVVELRRVLPVLAEHERWNTYVTGLNAIGTCLLNLGRLDEARREYARALRLAGRKARPAVHAFIRANLARTLFEGKRFAEAARAFEEAARHFSAQGAMADELTMYLFRVEALARSGAIEKARSVAVPLFEEVRRLGAADHDLLESFEAALKGDLPDLDLLESLRDRAEEQISERLRRVV
jgi:tetratricopeptide (TPR) repeat protein